jgi:hypothetical protein
MPAKGVDRLLVTGLEETAHCERLFVVVVAETRCAQMRVSAVERCQRQNAPRLFPGFFERERRGWFLNPHRDHPRRLVREDHVLDGLGVAERAVGAIARADRAADAQIDLGQRGAKRLVAFRRREHFPDCVDRRGHHAFVDERHFVGLCGAAGSRKHE